MMKERTPREYLQQLFSSKSQVRVNLVCPGFIDTPMHRRGRAILGDELYDKGLLSSVHLRRAGRPEEIARSIVFLCSDEASYITGTTLTPDGGFTLTR
jgi:NAD(P)-dependent dehydrogenase (short-subunit alcohol dehydrogenase family)